MRRIYLLILLLLGCVLFPGDGRTVAVNSTANGDYVGNEILVKFVSGLPAAEKKNLNRLTKVSVVEDFAD